MPNNKVYYQGCISCGWRDCFLMECTERDKCPQFKEYEKKHYKKRENIGTKLEKFFIGLKK